MLSKRWYVAHCHANREFIAVENLIQQGIEVYAPFFMKVVRHARKIIEKKAPLFPRYIFVNFDIDADAWPCINNTRGVSKLICSQSDRLPLAVKPGVIELLRASENESGIVSLAALEYFKVGQKVRLVEGPFSGCVATYQGLTDNQRVEVLLNLLHTDVCMKVYAHEIEKL